MESLRQIFNTVQSVSKAIIALCMIAMMVVIFAQTSTRYLIFYSIPWSEEVSRYLYVALTLLGLNLAITSKQLVRIDIIDNYLKGSGVSGSFVSRSPRPSARAVPHSTQNGTSEPICAPSSHSA